MILAPSGKIFWAFFGDLQMTDNIYKIQYFTDPPDRNKRYGDIYLVRNRHNNKLYVGQTTRARYGAKEYIVSRWARHCDQARNILRGRKNSIDYFHNALLKWGKIECHFLDAFEVSVIDYAENAIQLNLLETQYIGYFNSQDNTIGYNVRAGGLGGTMTEDTVKKRIENRRLERERLTLQHGFPIIEGKKKLKQMNADPKLIRMSSWWANAKTKGWLGLEWTEKLVGWSRFYHEVGQYIDSDYWLIEPIDRSKPMNKDNVTWEGFDSKTDMMSAYLNEIPVYTTRSKSYSGGSKLERREDELACSEFRYRWSTETQDWFLRPGKTALITDD